MTTTAKCGACGSPRKDGKPLCNRHMESVDRQLVERWFNRARRLRREPSAEAAALLEETTRDLVAQAQIK